MNKFQKTIKDIVTILNIAIIITIINLVGNFIVDVGFSKLNLSSLLAYIIVSVIALGLLFCARELAKKEKILGGILTFIAGILMIIFGGLIDTILGVFFIVASIAYFIAFNKYKK